jgi:hypothetical protein
MSKEKNQFAFSVVEISLATKWVFHGIVMLVSLIVVVLGCK